MNNVNNVNNEKLQEFLNKYNKKKRIETTASYNIVEYLDFIGEEPAIDLVLDAFTYEAPETVWNVKLNRYVETGNTIEKAAVIVHNHVKKNDYLIYLPLSCVEMVKELVPILRENSGIRIILSTFEKDQKRIGYIEGFECV